MCSTVSVSYTHLDVYKRQVLYEETAGDKNLITRELLTSWVENEGNGYITRMDKTISEILVGACLLYTSRCV